MNAILDTIKNKYKKDKIENLRKDKNYNKQSYNDVKKWVLKI